MSPNKPDEVRNSPVHPAIGQSGRTVEERLADLESLIGTLRDGRIGFDTDIIGAFETVSVAPTTTAKDVFDQVKLYVNGTTYRLYIYDQNAHVWHYATLT